METCKLNIPKFKALLLFSIALLFAINAIGQSNPNVVVYENYINSNWVNNRKTLNIYNEYNKVATSLEQYWNTTSSIWEDNRQIFNTYNTDGKLTESLYKFWYAESSSWENEARNTYTYNTNYKIVTQLSERWNFDTNTWGISSTINNTYDVNGYLTMSVYEIFDSGILESRGRQLYFNTSDGLIDNYIYQFWENDTWYNQSKYILTYTATGKEASSTLLRSINTSEWEIAGRISSTYDASENRIYQSSENFENNAFVPHTQSFSTFYPNGPIDNQLAQIYTNSAWVNLSRWTYYYNTLEVAEHNNQNAILAYPNPASEQITIKSNLADDKAIYCILDETGKLVLNGKIIVPENIVDVTNLVNGVYFILMKDLKPFKFIKK